MLALGCGSSGREETTTLTTAPTTLPMDGSSGGSLDDSASDDAGKLDTPGGSGMTADDGGTNDGCQKVDFLFVVDNSGSMANEQAQLVASFPGFVQSIRDNLEAQDYHIMVVDSDADGTWACEPPAHTGDPVWDTHCATFCATPCPSIAGLCTSYTCGSQATLAPEDLTLGCGVRGPYGGEASNVDCGFDGPERFMFGTQSNLDQTFACAAKVGVSGHWHEAPSAGLRAALSPANSGAGGCNEGFLREDAILVVVFISDDVEQAEGPDEVVYGTGGTPQEWYTEVLAAKGGNADAVVMVGIVATPTPTAVVCDHGPDPFFGDVAAPKFVEFIQQFGDKGLLGDTCDPDYSIVFNQAVGLIDQTCDEFVPQG